MKDFLSRKSFPAVIFLLILLPVIIFIVHNSIETKKDLRDYSFSHQRTIVDLTTITLKEKFERIEEIGIALATRIQFRQKIEQGKWDEAIKIMNKVSINFPLIDSIGLVDTSGSQRAETPLSSVVSPGLNYSNEEWFKKVKSEKKPFISDAKINSQAQFDSNITVAIPIITDRGKLLGILDLRVKTSHLFSWLKSITLSDGGFLYIVDRKGTIVSTQSTASEDMYRAQPLIANVLQGKRGVELETPAGKTVTYITAYEQIKNYGWGVIATSPMKSVLEPLKKNLQRLKILNGLILIISCGLAYFISRIMIKLIKIQNEIKEAYQFTELVLDNVPDMIVAKDAKDLTFLQVNKAGEELLGYTKEEFVGKKDSDFFTKEQADYFNACDEEVFRSKKIMDIPEEKILTRSKGERLLRTQKIPVFDKDGSPQYLITISEDITDLKRMREERERTEILLKSANRINHLIQNSLDAVIAIDNKGLITVWNSQAENLFGTIAEDAIGKDLTNLILPSIYHETFRLGLAELLKTGDSPILNRHFEILAKRKNEELFPVEVSVTSLQDNDDQHFYAFVRDISERKLFEEKQKELLKKEHDAREVAEKLVNMRDDFLSIAAHELKTPITPISIQLQLMERALLKGKNLWESPENIEKLLKVTQNSKRDMAHLSKLIEELLDVSRISGDRFKIRVEKIYLSTLVQSMIERYSPEALQVGSIIESHIQSDVSGYWDHSRMESVVQNLLTNAIKYGEGKPIQVTLTKKDKQVVLTVRDHGIGIADEDKHKIFQRFERAVSVKKFSGLGLGLYITERIVVSHGGTIKVESHLGDGALFIVELPEDARAFQSPV